MRHLPLARTGLGEPQHHPAPPESHLRWRARSEPRVAASKHGADSIQGSARSPPRLVRPQPPSLRPMHVHVRQRLSARPPRSFADRQPTCRRHCLAMPRRPLRRGPLGSAPHRGLLHAAASGPAPDPTLARATFLRAPPSPAARLVGQRPRPPDDPTATHPCRGRVLAASGPPMSPSIRVARGRNWNQVQVMAPRLGLGSPDWIRSELPGRLESESDCQPRKRLPPGHGPMTSSRSQ
jgi:hypothetical protein